MQTGYVYIYTRALTEGSYTNKDVASFSQKKQNFVDQ